MANRQYLGWHKAKASNDPGNNCIEQGISADGYVGVRDTKDRGGPILEFAPQEWQTFVGAVRNGKIR